MKYLDSLIAHVRQKNCILVFSNLNRAILNIVLWRFPFKKKFWFENFRNSTCLGNGTFQLYRPDSSDRAFNYFSCKQDKKERYWGQQFKKWKGTFRSGPTEMSGPVKEDHLWKWSKIFRSDVTKMVRSAWFLTWFPEFWTEWKARSCKILSHMESTLKRCSHSRQPLSVVDPGEGPGGALAPLIFGPNWGPKSRKKFFFQTGSPLISGSGWPPPLIWMSEDVWYSKPQLLLLNCGTSFSFHWCKQALSSLILRHTIAMASS